ncbi:MAG TPA: MerR family transcriptional regulator [Ktedonobacteraceae bacterium]|nr:MerR family transcriptional regulator [Ktedonobacteraceae bacterium]
MEDRNQKQRITQHLQGVEVQQRILRDMRRAREEASVTISNAASLFGFTENQLRDWEKNGLLNPLRRAQDAEQDGKGPKRRQYTTAELDKLAIIRELMNAGFSPGTIPSYVDEMWTSVANRIEFQEARSIQQPTKHIPVDQRIRTTNEELFWRYFASQALRLSLMLICEDIPNTKAGLILPLNNQTSGPVITSVDGLSSLGECLVGWISLNHSSYAFLDHAPSFEHSSDFRVHRLQVMNRNMPDLADVPQQNIYIVLQREAKSLTLTAPVVRVIRSLLAILNENMNEVYTSLSSGMRDWPYQATDFRGSVDPSDDILNAFADTVVAIGKGHWSFSGILLPQDASLPMPQHSLVVRAQSKDAPYILAITLVSAITRGLSFRAYQSGQVLYRSEVSNKDFLIAYQEREEATRSAIAFPLSGRDGLSMGVLYIASAEANAFDEHDEQLLRLVGRMLEELLMTYRSRQLSAGRLTDIITTPEVVDISFKEFASESDFVNDLERLLKTIHEQGVTPELVGKELSIIAVDIDNLAGIAAKYGDVVARNLSMAVGERIQGNPSVLPGRQLYHSNADRYCFLRKDIQIEEARNHALALKARLKEEYRIDVRRIFTRRAVLPSALLRLSDVTVRLSVHSYTYEKLNELLERYDSKFAVSSLSGVLLVNIDKALDMAQDLGGNVVISWDREKWGYVKLPST